MSLNAERPASDEAEIADENASDATGSLWISDLQRLFGFPAFRSGQGEVVARLMAGDSVAAIFPTGAGKSLCYQLPALLLPGTTLVVSPLLALMRQQVDDLQARSLAAARLDSTLSGREAGQVLDRLVNGQLKLLYVAPERLANRRFRRLLLGVKIDLLAIDEAHCISQWGHNFRPDYLRLAGLRQELDVKRVLALTATARPNVVDDIAKVFEISPENVVRTPFRRNNLILRFEATTPARRITRLVEHLRSHPGSAIVYTTFQRTAEEVAAALVEHGIDASAYHAGMEDVDRQRIQDEFIRRSGQVVVATIAFGMGIDKPDVRSVVHYNLSSGLESYAQEIGRAGRDGKDAVCLSLICREDRVPLENFAYGDTPDNEALRGFVATVADQGREFELSLYSMAYDFDVREAVLRTMLTYLELEGYVESLGAQYSRYQLKLLRTPERIVQSTPTNERSVVAEVLQLTVRKRKYVELDVSTAMERLSLGREDIAGIVESIVEGGGAESSAAGVLSAYRKTRDFDDSAAVARLLRSRLRQLEQATLKRVDDLIGLAVEDRCQTGRLAKYFGDRVGRPCRRCTACRGESPSAQEFVPPHGQLGTSIASQLPPLREKYPQVFQRDRQVAKFLCGISTPRSLRYRLTRHPLYGCCNHLRLPDCTELVEGLS